MTEATLRERAVLYGVGTLTLAETMALVIGGPKATEKAEAMLAKQDLLAWLNATLAELELWVSPAAAARLVSSFHLTRLIFTQSQQRVQITCPLELATFIRPYLVCQEQEEVWIICMSRTSKVRHVEMLYRGSTWSTVLRIAEVLRPAVRLASPGFFLAHNHPSGDPTPSPEDVVVTERILRMAHQLGIDLQDHIIIGSGTDQWVSMKERKLGFSEWD